MFQQKKRDLPRIDGECLVVPYDYELPRRSILTGGEHALEQLTERASSGGCLMLLLLGPLGLLLGSKSARITYYIESDLIRKTGNWRLASLVVLLIGFSLIGLAYCFEWFSLFIAGFVAIILSLVLRRMFGGRIKISNVWESEIFIRNLPDELLKEVLVTERPESNEAILEVAPDSHP